MKYYRCYFTVDIYAEDSVKVGNIFDEFIDIAKSKVVKMSKARLDCIKISDNIDASLKEKDANTGEDIISVTKIKGE